MTVGFVSTFLSYSWADRAALIDLANELGRWGVLPWVDDDRAHAGDRISSAVKQAIEDQAFFTVLLSPDSARSDWVLRELSHARSAVGEDRMFPVCLGMTAKEAFRGHPPLADWADGERERLAVEWPGGEIGDVAARLAKAFFARLSLSRREHAVVCLDQRGRGPRIGPPELPEEVRSTGVPALVFRQDRGPRTEVETLAGDAWTRVGRRLREALGEAYGQHTQRNVHLCGNAQLGLAWLVGQHFDRESGATLHCYNIRDRYNEGRQCFQSDDVSRLLEKRAGPGGAARPTPAPSPHPYVEDMGRGASFSAFALLLGPERYVCAASEHARGALGCPLVWLEAPEVFRNRDEVLDFGSDAIRLIQSIQARHHAREVHLLNCLPFHATPLLAAHMRKVLPGVRYREYRRDFEDLTPLPPPEDMYAPLAPVR